MLLTKPETSFELKMGTFGIFPVILRWIDPGSQYLCMIYLGHLAITTQNPSPLAIHGTWHGRDFFFVNFRGDFFFVNLAICER